MLYLGKWMHFMASKAPMEDLKQRIKISSSKFKGQVHQVFLSSSHCIFSLYPFSSLTVFLINTLIYKSPKWIFFLCSILSPSNPLTNLATLGVHHFFFFSNSTKSMVCLKQIFFIIKMNSSHQSKEVSAQNS